MFRIIFYNSNGTTWKTGWKSIKGWKPGDIVKMAAGRVYELEVRI